MKKKSRCNTARKVLLFWCLFIGIGAVGGAACMLLDPTGRSVGMDGLLPGLRKLPFAEVLFQNLLFAGVSLLIVNGLSNLTAAWLLLRKKKAGLVLGTVFGVTLMLWICIQFFIFPCNVLSVCYFVFGLCQFICGCCALVFFKQESFSFCASDYPNIGRNPRRLVVYFSRMGYTRKLAYAAANETGASIYELKALEPTAGTGGFWWCGRFAMHRWEMPIEAVPLDLAQYDHVTICTPIWAFSVSAPVRAFCRTAKIKSADYIFTHHTKSSYTAVADEMDRLLGLTRTGLQSICCHKGSYIQ